MKTQLTRTTISGAAYLDLQRLAKRTGALTEEMLQLYVLEGFLARLSVSPYAAQLVLKGGVLLAAYQVRRPTRDIDIQASAVKRTLAEVSQMMTSIAGLERADGVEFNLETVQAETIREEETYNGVRVKMDSRLATARLPFHIDVNFGDPVWPPPRTIDLPCLLGGSIKLVGYPVPMILAEKIVTALQRGPLNTRWRDFADIYQLFRNHQISGDELKAACTEVASYRQILLTPIREIVGKFGRQAESQWDGWCRRQRRRDQLPALPAILAAIADFADPVLAGEVDGMTWLPGDGEWVGV